jgi:DmsE family decaheme c-type cytochrome
MRVSWILWVCAGLMSAQKPAGDASGYAGNEACAACHEELATAFAKTSHRAIEREKKRGWEGRSCESCHGPGLKHGESGGDIAAIVNPAKLPAVAENQSCLGCHSNRPARAGGILSGHGGGEVACGACHTVHPKPPGEAKGSQELVTRRKSAQNAQCASCHPAAEAAFQRPHTHPVAQGAMSCVDCHNPHAGTGFDGHRATFANESPCLTCHANLRGPFVFEHAPMRLEGCGACHAAHGSVNPKLLTRAEVRTVCLECHSDLTAVSGLPGGAGAVPPAFHDLRSPRIQACSTCHRKIHGSNVDRSLRR